MICFFEILLNSHSNNKNRKWSNISHWRGGGKTRGDEGLVCTGISNLARAVVAIQSVDGQIFVLISTNTDTDRFPFSCYRLLIVVFCYLFSMLGVWWPSHPQGVWSVSGVIFWWLGPDLICKYDTVHHDLSVRRNLCSLPKHIPTKAIDPGTLTLFLQNLSITK